MGFHKRCESSDIMCLNSLITRFLHHRRWVIPGDCSWAGGLRLVNDGKQTPHLHFVKCIAPPGGDRPSGLPLADCGDLCMTWAESP